MKIFDIFKGKNKNKKKAKKKKSEGIDQDIIKRFEDRDSCL